MRGLVRLLALLAGLAAASWVPAQQAAGDPSWASLTPAQRSALAPLERDWATIDVDRKQKWLEIAARFRTMSPQERQRVQQRMTEWTRMTPQQRGQARLQFQQARQLTPQEKQARWEAYQALPAERKEELARRPARGDSRRADAERKSNVVPHPTDAGAAKPVAPTIVQAKPGATTTLVTKPPAPPPHQQPGLPKIAATPGFVDSATLLPKRGAQAAAVQPASAPTRGR
jgi:hypothetical protein